MSTKKLVLNMVGIILLIAVLQVIDYRYTDWQYWYVLISHVAYSLVNTYRSAIDMEEQQVKLSINVWKENK